MTTSTKYEESIKELSSQDENKRLKALRFIKNSVIGNKIKKELYIKLGIVQRLVEYLSLPDDTGYALKMQAVNILGSIAYGKNENVTAIVSSGAVTPLLDTLEIPPENAKQALMERRKLLEASTRALKAICSHSKVSRQEVFNPKHIHNITVLLDSTSKILIEESQNNVSSSEGISFAMIAEFTARIIANCCDTHEHQFMFKPVIKPLVMLLHSGCIKAQEAALDAIATLCRENKDMGSDLIKTNPGNSSPSPTIDTIVEFVKDKNPNKCLIAATCLTQFYRTGILNDSSSEILLVTLPALIKLLQDQTEGIQEMAPLVLADLIKDSEEMQKAAFDADTIPRLVELLVNNHFEEEKNDEPITQWGVPGLNIVVKSKAKIKENALIALAAATLLKEECRTQAIDSKVLPHVISGLSSKYTNIRLAACQCAKSLSRSVSHLRTSLMDSGVATPLVKLLFDEAPIVQAAACGALCNLVLEFSPVKQAVIEAGAIERFVEYTQSSDKDLQLNGVWALRNLLCKADLEAKKKVMDVLSYNALIDLLHEPNIAIQEQALEIVRNLVHGQQQDIDWVIEGIGKDDLLDVLENKLQVVSNMGIDDGSDEDAHSVTLIPALYIVVNMSSNDDPPKADIMSRSNIVNSVISHLEHSDPNVRVAAVWCIINWTWSNSEDIDEDEDLIIRCHQLRQLNIEECLVAMENDMNKDVCDRVSIALTQLRAVRE